MKPTDATPSYHPHAISLHLGQSFASHAPTRCTFCTRLQEVAQLAAKRAAAAKRRVSALQQEAEALLTEGRQRMEQVKARTGKLPGLARFLQQML